MSNINLRSLLEHDQHLKKLYTERINRLKSFGQFYIDSELDKQVLPKKVNIKGKMFHRYMDRIFSPMPIKKLDTVGSTTLCDIRLEYFDKIISDDYNKGVINFLVNNATNQGGILEIMDFGCGNGNYTSMIKDLLPNSNVVGVDVSSKAIKSARKMHSYISWEHIKEDKDLPYSDQSFDLIFSSFVMHFAIHENMLRELNRVLKDGGEFIFNIFKTEYLKISLLKKMELANFEVTLLQNSGFPLEGLFYKAKKNV